MSGKPEDPIIQSLISEYCKLNPYTVYPDITYSEEGKFGRIIGVGCRKDQNFSRGASSPLWIRLLEGEVILEL